MRNLLVVLSALLLVTRVHSAPALDTIEASVRKVLPQGWTLAFSKGRVIISKDQKVTFYYAVSLPSHEPAYLESLAREGTKGTFTIRLIITPRLSQKDYHDIKSSITREQREPKPRISIQSLYSENRNGLPERHGPDYSVYISTSRHPYQLVWPEDQNQEWQKVLAAVEGLFEEYK